MAEILHQFSWQCIPLCFRVSYIPRWLFGISAINSYGFSWIFLASLGAGQKPQRLKLQWRVHRYHHSAFDKSKMWVWMRILKIFKGSHIYHIICVYIMYIYIISWLYMIYVYIYIKYFQYIYIYIYIHLIIHTNSNIELDIQTLDFFESGKLTCAARFLNHPSCFGGWSWWPLGQGVYVKRILGESL